MKTLIRCIFLLLPLSGLAADRAPVYGSNKIYIPGFRTYTGSGYVPSEPNVQLLKGMEGKVTGLRLIAFEKPKKTVAMLVCRMSYPIYGPNKTPFVSLLEAAANLELGESGLAVADAPRVRAALDEFDFSSVGEGKWTIRATFTSEGKEPLVVKYVHSYPVSAGAVEGCKDVTYAMVTAIESFLRTLYGDARFLELMLAGEKP